MTASLSTSQPDEAAVPDPGAAPRSLDDLVDFVLDQTTSPVNTWAVAATLESRGVRDVDAQQRYGDADVFALADRVYAACRARLLGAGGLGEPQVSPTGFPTVLQRYGRGLISGLPMLVQTFSVLFLAFVLYALLGYDEERASVVALATLVSLVVTGGFVQCVGRLGVYYAEQRSFRLAQQVSWRLLRYGLTSAGVVGCLLIAVNGLAGWLPAGLMLDAAIYYALLTLLWLLLAVLYAMQLRISIVLLFLATALVAALTHRLFPSSLEVAHWSGLVAADLGAAFWARRSLRRRAAADDVTGVVKRLPRRAIQAYGLAPYFIYGMLYFGFLFLDRLLAWTVGGGHPLPFWFDASYEVGLDLALVVLVLMLPQLEYAVRAFSESMTPVQTSFSAAQARSHNRHYLRFYGRQLLLLLALGACSAGLVTSGVLWLRSADRLPLDGSITWYVFLAGTAGYGLLVVALLNGVFLFSLSRPWPAVGALSVAVCTDATVGWVLSRQGEYWWSVGGLVAGAAVFAGLTSVATVRVLRRLDYYYYSAY